MDRPSFKIGVLALFLPLLVSCSLKGQGQGGFRVQLAPTPLVPAPAELSLFALNSAGSPDATSLGDLNCFAVNVRGGAIPTQSVCGGLQLGIADGSYDGITSTFEPFVPVGDTLIFEALGTKAASCSNIYELTSGGTVVKPQVFRIGTAQASVSKETDSVTIPVGFQATDAFACAGAGVFPVFADSFNGYASGRLTSSVSGGRWVDISSSLQQFRTGSDVLTAISGDSLYAIWSGRTNDSLPYTGLSVQVTGTGSSYYPVVHLAIQDTEDLTPSYGFRCSLDLGQGGPGSLTVINFQNTSSQTSTLSFPVTQTVILTCQKHKLESGRMLGVAAVLSTSGAVLNQVKAEFEASTVAANRIRVSTTVTTGATLTLDNFALEQSQTAQPHP